MELFKTKCTYCTVISRFHKSKLTKQAHVASQNSADLPMILEKFEGRLVILFEKCTVHN